MIIVKHSFDWKGFKYALRLFAVIFSIGFVGYSSAGYVRTTLFPSTVAAALSFAGEVRDGFGAYSSTTPRQVISSLTTREVVPATGKFIAADLEAMTLSLYQDGEVVETYPILTKGRPGSPYETPGGFYSILFKTENHFNKTAKVYMPYSMQFYGNYFIHGWPYYENGTPVESTFSGGCIRLSTDDAEKVYTFAERGTGMFVYDPEVKEEPKSLALGTVALPKVTADAYLVADVDTGDVLLSKNSATPYPIASVTKLMTALVANETIMFDREIKISAGVVRRSGEEGQVELTVEELLHPLLMESNNRVAERLAAYYSTGAFIGWMNSAAKALNMQATRFEDASGISPNNVSTTEDLFRLVVYLTNKKSFIWDITREAPGTEVVATNGESFSFKNFNQFSHRSDFIGGKIGHTGEARDTMVSLFKVPVGGEERRIAVVILHSDNYTTDTAMLSEWAGRSIALGAEENNVACVACADESGEYRKIELENF